MEIGVSRTDLVTFWKPGNRIDKSRAETQTIGAVKPSHVKYKEDNAQDGREVHPRLHLLLSQVEHCGVLADQRWSNSSLLLRTRVPNWSPHEEFESSLPGTWRNIKESRIDRSSGFGKEMGSPRTARVRERELVREKNRSCHLCEYD